MGTRFNSKFKILILFMLWGIVFLAACGKNNVSSITLYRNGYIEDSVLLDKKADIRLVEQVMFSKKAVEVLFPIEYYLKINYKNGFSKEYSGNNIYLRDETYAYVISDSNVQKKYLDLIDYKLSKIKPIR